MKKSQFVGLCVAMVGASFLGGMLAVWVVYDGDVQAAGEFKDGHFKTVTAENIIVVDDKDKARIRMTVGEDGPGFFLRGKEQSGFSIQTVVDGIPRMYFRDAKGGTRISIDPELVDSLGPCITLMDEKGETRVGLSGGGGRYEPSIIIMDEKGETRASLNTSSLALADANGTIRATLGVTKTRNKKNEAVTKTSESTLTLSSSIGDVLWQAP